MRLTVQVSLARLDARLAAAKGRIASPEVLLSIAQAGANIFEAEEKTLAPTVTGELRDSIQQMVIESSSTRARVAVVPTAPHAKRIEFGYKGPDVKGRRFHQGPHSYIRAAYDAKKDEARQAMKDRGGLVIRQALK